jgi:hypothetical protein
MSRLLFLTNSEHGQANTMLAVAHDLVLLGCEVHIASFSPLASRVKTLQKRIDQQHHQTKGKLYMHLIPGLSMLEKCERENINWYHQAGFCGAIQGYRKSVRAMAPWSVAEYAAMYDFCIALGQRVEPHLKIVDSLFSPGIDACSRSPDKYVIINAISHSNVITVKQSLSFIAFKSSP